MPEVQVVARYTVRIGQEHEVLALIAQFADATRAEPGCRWFEVYLETGNARHIALLIRFTSRDALDEHVRSAHYKQFVVSGCEPRLDRRVVEAFDIPADGASLI
jgi:quinol monooxygenase YgiN